MPVCRDLVSALHAHPYYYYYYYAFSRSAQPQGLRGPLKYAN